MTAESLKVIAGLQIDISSDQTIKSLSKQFNGYRAPDWHVQAWVNAANAITRLQKDMLIGDDLASLIRANLTRSIKTSLSNIPTTPLLIELKNTKYLKALSRTAPLPTEQRGISCRQIGGSP